ncbi:hypothetical protein Zm00014a_036342, partial [Zea mays]
LLREHCRLPTPPYLAHPPDATAAIRPPAAIPTANAARRNPRPPCEGC